MSKEALQSVPTALEEIHDDGSGYLTALLASAPADVRARLAEIGEFPLGEDSLAQMRGRQIRDPGTLSGAVEHADRLAPGGPGNPDVPARLHQERGITERRLR